jgi:hypothetical protein
MLHRQRHVFIDGTRMGLLLGDAELGEQVEDRPRLDLQLPSELVDSDFLHTWRRRRYL